MSFTDETSTIEKDAKHRSETKNITFFATMFILYSKRLVAVKNILRKIHFHTKAFKARIACLLFQQITIFLKYKLTKKSSHLLTTFCVVIQLTTILHGNYSDLALICLSVSISMEINEFLHI